MNSGVALSFFVAILGIAGWAILRMRFHVNQQHTNIIKAVIILLLIAPSFLGFEDTIFVTKILWPFLAGLFIGEIAINYLQNKMKKQDEMKTEIGFEEPVFNKEKMKRYRKETPEERAIRIANETPEQKELRRKRREAKKAQEKKTNDP